MKNENIYENNDKTFLAQAPLLLKHHHVKIILDKCIPQSEKYLDSLE